MPQSMLLVFLLIQENDVSIRCATDRTDSFNAQVFVLSLGDGGGREEDKQVACEHTLGEATLEVY